MANQLDWKGDEVMAQVMANLEAAMNEISLEVEGEAKQELYKGHGVLTGTLRRDLHAEDSEVSGTRVTGRVGAWVDYALPVHQGHHGFEGYHYIAMGLQRVKERVDSILSKHRIKR